MPEDPSQELPLEDRLIAMEVILQTLLTCADPLALRILTDVGEEQSLGRTEEPGRMRRIMAHVRNMAAEAKRAQALLQAPDQMN